MAPRLLLASANQGKLRELRSILAGLPVELVGLAEAGPGEPPGVEETGDTFLENALLKARAYAAWSGLAAVADDSGLEVDALGGAPGVRSARYAGQGAGDQANRDKLLAALAGVPPERRAARFRCAAVLVDPDVGEWHAEAAWEGRLLEAPRGSGENICMCTRALGQALLFQRSAIPAGGRRQHASSGQVDCARSVVSRPRHQRASSNGTPTVIEKPPPSVDPVCVEHQNVPDGVSVYW